MNDVSWALWVRQFNWVNWLGVTLFLVPVVLGYFAVHWWLVWNDPVLFYASMYAQLCLLLCAWRQFS